MRNVVSLPLLLCLALATVGCELEPSTSVRLRGTVTTESTVSRASASDRIESVARGDARARCMFGDLHGFRVRDHTCTPFDDGPPWVCTAKWSAWCTDAGFGDEETL